MAFSITRVKQKNNAQAMLEREIVFPKETILFHEILKESVVKIYTDHNGTINGKINGKDVCIVGIPKTIDLKDKILVKTAQEILSKDSWIVIRQNTIVVNARLMGGGFKEDKEEFYKLLEEVEGRQEIKKICPDSTSLSKDLYKGVDNIANIETDLLHKRHKWWKNKWIANTSQENEQRIQEILIKMAVIFDNFPGQIKQEPGFNKFLLAAAGSCAAIPFVGWPAAIVTVGSTGMCQLYDWAEEQKWDGLKDTLFEIINSDSFKKSKNNEEALLNKDISPGELKENLENLSEYQSKLTAELNTKFKTAGLKKQASVIKEFKEFHKKLLEEMKKEQDELIFKQKLEACKSIANLLPTVCQFVAPDAMKEAVFTKNVLNKSIDIVEHARKFSQIAWKGNLLVKLGSCANIANALLTIASEIVNWNKTDPQTEMMQYISEQISDFRKKMHDNFQHQNKMLIDMHVQILEEFSDLTQGITAVSKQITAKLDVILDTTVNGFVAIGKTKFEKFMPKCDTAYNDTKYDDTVKKNRFLKIMDKCCEKSEIGFAGQDHLTSNFFSGHEPNGVISLLSGTSLEYAINYLVKHNFVNGEQISSKKFVNPYIWTTIVNTYLNLREKYPKFDKDLNKANHHTNFKRLFTEGRNLLELIKNIQGNKNFFENRIKEYEAAIKACKLDKEEFKFNTLEKCAQPHPKPDIKEKLNKLDACFLLLRACIELAFNSSYNMDGFFASFLRSSVEGDNILPTKEKLTDFYEKIKDLPQFEKDKKCQLFFYEQIENLDLFQAILNKKIEAISKGEASDPYSTIELTLHRLCQFEKKHFKKQSEKIEFSLPPLLSEDMVMPIYENLFAAAKIGDVQGFIDAVDNKTLAGVEDSPQDSNTYVKSIFHINDMGDNPLHMLARFNRTEMLEKIYEHYTSTGKSMKEFAYMLFGNNKFLETPYSIAKKEKNEAFATLCLFYLKEVIEKPSFKTNDFFTKTSTDSSDFIFHRFQTGTIRSKSGQHAHRHNIRIEKKKGGNFTSDFPPIHLQSIADTSNGRLIKELACGNTRFESIGYSKGHFFFTINVKYIRQKTSKGQIDTVYEDFCFVRNCKDACGSVLLKLKQKVVVKSFAVFNNRFVLLIKNDNSGTIYDPHSNNRSLQFNSVNFNNVTKFHVDEHNIAFLFEKSRLTRYNLKTFENLGTIDLSSNIQKPKKSEDVQEEHEFPKYQPFSDNDFTTKDKTSTLKGYTWKKCSSFAGMYAVSVVIGFVAGAAGAKLVDLTFKRFLEKGK